VSEQYIDNNLFWAFTCQHHFK